MPSSLKTPALSAAGLLILLIVWQIGTQLLAERMPLANMLAPVPTFQSLWDLLIHNQLTGHIIASLKRVAVGLLWALAFGVPLGLLIGHGCTVKSALNEMTMVAEGYFAADCIRHINFRHRVDMPIADMVYRVLYEGASARRCMQELTTKLIKLAI